LPTAKVNTMNPEPQTHQWRVIVERSARTGTRFCNTLEEALAVAKAINENSGKPVAFVATPMAGAVPGTEPWLAE
jgi:hypothetical protein